MIDWDAAEIKMIDKHYREVLEPSIDFIYFCQHFEEMYKVTTSDGVLLPDILNDITFYTLNGINAKYKILVFTKDDEELTEKLTSKRMEQRAKRQEAHSKGLTEYHEFILGEVKDFVEKYPFWNRLLRQ
jgi:hypothetical protein